MYAAAIPFAASFYFLFAPPDGLSEMGLFWWLIENPGDAINIALQTLNQLIQ